MLYLVEAFQLQNYITVHAFITIKIKNMHALWHFWWVTYKVQILINLLVTFRYCNFEEFSLD